jgi:protein-disulfide isomerase
MRLTYMTCLSRTRLTLAALALTLAVAATAHAQFSAPPNTANAFRDTSMVKPPVGAKIAIYEFEDLECPACSRAFPIVHAAIDHYKIPLVRHDFPLKMHLWSRDAAITARYIQDKIDPKLAEDYRRAVFASQQSIASKDDLQSFTQKFFQSHGRTMPFVVDPSGLFAAEVQSDYTLGERIGLTQTPTIFVVTQKNWIQITDINQLYATIDTTMAQLGTTSTTANSKPKHAPSIQK